MCWFGRHPEYPYNAVADNADRDANSLSVYATDEVPHVWVVKASRRMPLARLKRPDVLEGGLLDREGGLLKFLERSGRCRLCDFQLCWNSDMGMPAR